MRRYRQMLAETLGKSQSCPADKRRCRCPGCRRTISWRHSRSGDAVYARGSLSRCRKAGTWRSTPLPCRLGSQIMKPSQFISRKLGLRSVCRHARRRIWRGCRPLRAPSPIQVTTLRVESGLAVPSDIRHRHGRSKPAVAISSARRLRDASKPYMWMWVRRSRLGSCWPKSTPVDLDERLRSTEGFARAASAVTAAEAQRKDALARRQLAELNAKRYRDLGGKNFVSASAVESKQQELILARQRLKPAKPTCRRSPGATSAEG